MENSFLSTSSLNQKFKPKRDLYKTLIVDSKLLAEWIFSAVLSSLRKKLNNSIYKNDL